MVDWLRQFFDTNQVVLFFLYGQVFFVVGLAIAVQSRRHSRLALVSSLPSLAVFGVASGLAQWGHVFVPIQTAYLDAQQVSGLEFVRITLQALSFAALMRFGLMLMSPRPVAPGWATWMPVGVLLGWDLALIGCWLAQVAPDQILLMYGDALGHYVIAGPAALIAAVGLNHHVRHEIKPLNLPAIEKFLRLASWSLVSLAVFSISFVPYAPFLPANVLNHDLLKRTIGVPVEVFLSILGVALAYGVIRAMEIFQIETALALEEASRTRVLMADRERIGRELHDGTIQSLYAAGLMIESASYLMDESHDQSKAKLAQVMQSLNDTIQEIRRYIFDLRSEPQAGSSDLEHSLSQLAGDLRINTLLSVDVVLDGHDPHELSPEQQQHILRIVQEAFVNTARHAQAKRVSVRLQWAEERLRLRIADDGIGLTASPNAGRGHGLRNMRERANLLGGRLTVKSQPGRGVVIELEAPYRAKVAVETAIPVL
jgi:signal transduction histidine kinase